MREAARGEPGGPEGEGGKDDRLFHLCRSDFLVVVGDMNLRHHIGLLRVDLDLSDRRHTRADQGEYRRRLAREIAERRLAAGEVAQPIARQPAVPACRYVL